MKHIAPHALLLILSVACGGPANSRFERPEGPTNEPYADENRESSPSSNADLIEGVAEQISVEVGYKTVQRTDRYIMRRSSSVVYAYDLETGEQSYNTARDHSDSIVGMSDVGFVGLRDDDFMNVVYHGQLDFIEAPKDEGVRSLRADGLVVTAPGRVELLDIETQERTLLRRLPDGCTLERIERGVELYDCQERYHRLHVEFAGSLQLIDRQLGYNARICGGTDAKVYVKYDGSIVEIDRASGATRDIVRYESERYRDHLPGYVCDFTGEHVVFDFVPNADHICFTGNATPPPPSDIRAVNIETGLVRKLYQSPPETCTYFAGYQDGIVYFSRPDGHLYRVLAPLPGDR